MKSHDYAMEAFTILSFIRCLRDYLDYSPEDNSTKLETAIHILLKAEEEAEQLAEAL